MFYFDSFYGKKILKSSLLSDYDCFFTTRDFVLTPSNRVDLTQTANKNREFLLEKLNHDKITSAIQTHSDNIRIVSEEKVYENTDALISNLKKSVLLLNFADCTPIILYSPKDNTGAVIHAGWRGTASKIALKTVEKIKNEFLINPKNIVALIGPSIGKCCFETGKEVFEQLIDDYDNSTLYLKKNDKYFIDLKELNKQQLLYSGVEKIDICDYCTCCMSDIFFSYRKEHGITARHSAIVKIKN